jgi:hypothetical protein
MFKYIISIQIRINMISFAILFKPNNYLRIVQSNNIDRLNSINLVLKIIKLNQYNN